MRPTHLGRLFKTGVSDKHGFIDNLSVGFEVIGLAEGIQVLHRPKRVEDIFLAGPFRIKFSDFTVWHACVSITWVECLAIDAPTIFYDKHRKASAGELVVDFSKVAWFVCWAFRPMLESRPLRIWLY